METIFEKEQINVTDILNLKVSYQPNAYSSFTKEIPIKQVLEEIKNETHSGQINRLRELLNSGDDNGYGMHKRNLAAVTFCGTFDKERKKSALKNYNHLIVLDIDKLNPAELQKVKDSFASDKFVFSFWESPSQKGIKGLVHLSYSTEPDTTNLDNAHKAAFRKLEKYFEESYSIELDISGSDTTRLCFLSYDPATVIKPTVTSFEISETDILEVHERKAKTDRAKTIRKSSKDALFNPLNRNHPRSRKTITAIIRFLNKRNLSITNSYEHWYKISLAIANTFTYEIGEKYFLQLSAIDKGKFNETNCRNLLLNSYEIQTGEISFKTIEYLAIQQGYITKRIREGSSAVADERMSQVSTSIDGSLPEVLKSGE
jgi:hypothetical protein